MVGLGFGEWDLVLPMGKEDSGGTGNEIDRARSVAAFSGFCLYEYVCTVNATE